MTDTTKMDNLLAWRRDAPSGPSHAPAKKARQAPQKSSLETMHGAKLSDHQEKGGTWAGYWEMRENKLSAQAVDNKLYSGLAGQLAGASGSTGGDIFHGCRLYFNGRVDGNGQNLSCFELGKLARLHGAMCSPRLTVRGVTHVVCTRLSGSKEQKVQLATANRGSRT